MKQIMAEGKTVVIKQRTEPWKNTETLETIQGRKKSFLKFSKTQDQSDFSSYKSLSNPINEEAKKIYSSDQSVENLNNRRRLCQSLKQFGNSKRRKTKSKNVSLNRNGKTTSEKTAVADGCNTF